jgi:hypothetical protein
MKRQTTERDVVAAVSLAKRQILADIATGRVPATVATFGELHDYVDANEYGGLCRDDSPFRNDDDGPYGPNEVQERVHRWLLAGRPQPVSATRVVEARPER